MQGVEVPYFSFTINNTIIQSTMQSVRDNINIVLISKEHQQRWQTSKSVFRRFEIFDEDLVGVEVVKPKTEQNKPILVGNSILDLSKKHMYDFWHIQCLQIEVRGLDTVVLRRYCKY